MPHKTPKPRKTEHTLCIVASLKNYRLFYYLIFHVKLYRLTTPLSGCLLFPFGYIMWCSVNRGKIQIYGSPCPAYCIIHQWDIIPRRAYIIVSDNLSPLCLPKVYWKRPTADVNKTTTPKIPPMKPPTAKTAPPKKAVRHNRSIKKLSPSGAIAPQRPANSSIYPNQLIFSYPLPSNQIPSRGCKHPPHQPTARRYRVERSAGVYPQARLRRAAVNRKAKKKQP